MGIPDEILFDERLSLNDVRLCRIIHQYKTCFIGNKKISEQLGISQQSVTDKLLKLERLGLLSRTKTEGRRVLALHVIPTSPTRDNHVPDTCSTTSPTRDGPRVQEVSPIIINNTISKFTSDGIDDSLSEHFIVEKQDISTGRMPLKRFPNVYLTPVELEDLRKLYTGVDLKLVDGVKNFLSLYSNKLERWRIDRSFYHLQGHIFKDLCEQANSRDRRDREILRNEKSN